MSGAVSSAGLPDTGGGEEVVVGAVDQDYVDGLPVERLRTREATESPPTMTTFGRATADMLGKRWSRPFRPHPAVAGTSGSVRAGARRRCRTRNPDRPGSGRGARWMRAIGRSLPSGDHERLTHAFQASPSIPDDGLRPVNRRRSCATAAARGQRGRANLRTVVGCLFVGESHTTRMGRPWRR